MLDGHDWHTVALDAPTVSEYVPASHARQVSAPVAEVLGEYFPAPHCEQVEALVTAYAPAGQVDVSMYCSPVV